MNQSFFFPQQFLHVFHRERERETAEYPCLLPSEIKEDTENKEVFFFSGGVFRGVAYLHCKEGLTSESQGNYIRGGNANAT